MTVGLTVDCIIHITQAIANAKTDDDDDDGYIQRLEIAMTEMGGCVFKGAITTFIG